MEISFKYDKEIEMSLKNFLKDKGLSRRLLADFKNNDGQILVNGKKTYLKEKLRNKDIIFLRFPKERNRKHNLAKSFVPIKIVYEDRDYLVVFKPAYLTSIPENNCQTDSLLNRIAGYYQIKGYTEIIPHITTRLDRNTSGLVLVAKHRYAHALIDEQLKRHAIIKEYQAILEGNVEKKHLIISKKIDRTKGSIIKRRVASTGKNAITEIWTRKKYLDKTLCKIRLHTGRTHQIRVHCSYIGHPLISDTLYGGKIYLPLMRQALHCCLLKFYHPLKLKWMVFKASLPKDMREIL